MAITNPFEPFETMKKLLITPAGATANAQTTPATQGLGSLVSPTASMPVSQPAVVAPAPQIATSTVNAPGTANQGGGVNVAPIVNKPPTTQINAVQTQPIGGGGMVVNKPITSTQENTDIFQKLMGDYQTKIDTSNALMDTRNIMMTAMYDRPLTPEERAKLDPNVLKAIDSGDRATQDMNMRLINDQISGRTQSIDQAIKYLKDDYNTMISQVETAKENAISTAKDFLSIYGAEGLKSLYGSDVDQKLLASGIDIRELSGIPTLAETKAETGLTGPSSYQEWSLAGGLAGTGKTYAQFIETGKPATAAQQTVAGYAVRSEQALPIIKNLEKDISGMNSASFWVESRLPSSFQSSTYKAYDQASKNFINAVLRRESGAAIAQSEFDNAREQYLPMPGDNTTILKQKEDTRNIVYQNLVQSSGTAYTSMSDLLGQGLAAGGTTVMTGPDGQKWNVPNENVEIFKQNGYK